MIENSNSMNIKCIYLLFFAVSLYIFINFIQRDVLNIVEGLIGQTDAENQEQTDRNMEKNKPQKSSLFDSDIKYVPVSSKNPQVMKTSEYLDNIAPLQPDGPLTPEEQKFQNRVEERKNKRDTWDKTNAPWRQKDNTYNSREISCIDKSNLPMDLINQNEWCWENSTNMANCDISYISQDCSSIYLPTPSGLAVYNQSLSPTTTSTTSTTSTNTSTPVSNRDLDRALDNLEEKFIDRINVISTRLEDRNKIMFPTLNTSYMDIKNMTNGQYIYDGNKNCGNNPTSNRKGFSCYPTLTGDFQYCGPSPYQSPINI